MSAQPAHEEDPRDPQVILSTLPKREHAVFLRQYREAARAAADDPAKYRELAACLRIWGVRARLMPRVLAERPNYYEEVEAARQELRAGTVAAVPIEEAIAQLRGIPLEEATAYWEAQVADARRET